MSVQLLSCEWLSLFSSRQAVALPDASPLPVCHNVFLPFYLLPLHWGSLHKLSATLQRRNLSIQTFFGTTMGPHSLFQVLYTCALSSGPQADRLLFQEGLNVSFDPGAFQGSSKSKTVHLKAKYLTILRAQGSNNFWLEYVKKDK